MQPGENTVWFTDGWWQFEWREDLSTESTKWVVLQFQKYLWKMFCQKLEITCTVPLKDKRTIKRVDNALGTKSQRVWKKKKRVCELVFFQRVCPLLFKFGTFALCYKLVCKLRPQSDCNFSDGKWTSVINWLSINGKLERKSSGTRKDALV